MANLKRMENDMAVSPIVATLVLIVVAVIGAVAVGTIMGTFSTDVSKQANAGDASGAASTEILIAGSTTVQPASELLAAAYMAQHPGIKITVQGGGSGVGLTAAENGLVDIGSSSSTVSATAHPNLNVYQIGGSAVVVIGSPDTAAVNVTAADLQALYYDGTAIGDFTDAVQRNEESGTEEAFSRFINDDSSAGQLQDEGTLDATHVTAATGNAGVLAAVAAGEDTIGFVDFGIADAAGDDVQILNIEDEDGNVFTATSANIVNSLQGDANDPASTYVVGLTRPLNYVTLGTPSSIISSYIDFCRAPGAMDIMEEAGYVPYVTIA